MSVSLESVLQGAQSSPPAGVAMMVVVRAVQDGEHQSEQAIKVCGSHARIGAARRLRA